MRRCAAKCSSKHLPEIARCLRAPAILRLFFSLQSKLIVEIQVRSPRPAAGTAKWPGWHVATVPGCSQMLDPPIPMLTTWPRW